LAPEHPSVRHDARAVKLLQQPALAAAGVRFHEHEALPAGHRPFQLSLEALEVACARDECRLGEAAPPALVEPEDDLRILLAAIQRVADRAQVVPRRCGGLVAIVRVLAQQALHELIQRGGHLRTQRAQPPGTAGRVATQDLTDRVAEKRRHPGEALEQHDAGGVQV